MTRPEDRDGGARSSHAMPVSRISVEEGGLSPEWDAFVDRTPGGHHAQTSRWAQVKSVLGWEGTRLVVRRGDDIVGGVQLLTRTLNRAGAVSFAPRGPVLADPAPAVLQELHDALMEFGRERRVRYLKVQPPAGGPELRPGLRRLGYADSAMEAAPTADVRVDLTASEDEIFARVHKRTRSYIRSAARRGLILREGGEADLATYHRIVGETSRRQGFVPYPLEYYRTMWTEFAVDGRGRLLLAELDGVALSATLVIGFGDSVTYKMGGWAGGKTPVHPNEAIHWANIQWSKAAGYRFYDFDGVHKSIASALARDGELPESARHGVAAFKLQFCGDVVLFPEALDISPNAFLRPAVRLMAPRIDRMLPLAHRALGRGRAA
jgi:lipid II:glycine glycyltransferase (peptidoglycan interpeptide bridge formation enzyme)